MKPAKTNRHDLLPRTRRLFLHPAPAAMLALALLVPALIRGGAPSTYPPAMGTSPGGERCLALSRASLHAGRPEESYRHLLLAAPELGSTGEWCRQAALVYLALDRPMRAAEALALAGDRDPESLERAALLLRRQSPDPAPADFSPDSWRWPGLGRESLKDAREILPARDGTLWILGKDRIWQCSPEGTALRGVDLPGALDLVGDASGNPLAVGAAQVFWGDRLLPLPGGLQKPVSAAETPDGKLIILDGKAHGLVRVGASGRVEGRRAISLKEPCRVRIDGAGRIYILDRSSGSVSVFSAALVPLRVLSPEAAGLRSLRPDNLFVDFAGDVLLVDRRGDSAGLLSARGRLLGASDRKVVRMEASGWDGGPTALYLNRRPGLVGRVGL